MGYEMHDEIVCKGLGEFDQQLNLLKVTIIRMAEATNGKEEAEKFLIDDTQVMAMNDELTIFQIIVCVKIGNAKVWKRISEVQLDSKTKLVSLAKIISIQVVEDKKTNDASSKQEESIDEKQNDLQNIHADINNKATK